MANQNTKILYDWKGEQLGVTDMVKLYHKGLTPTQITSMGTRHRYHIRSVGLERAMVILAQSEPPIPQGTKAYKPRIKRKTVSIFPAYEAWKKAGQQGEA